MEQKTACVLITVGIVLAISIILFACSWDTIEPVEWGILCNSISKNCDATESLFFINSVILKIFKSKFMMEGDILFGWHIISSHSPQPIRPLSFLASVEQIV